MPPPRNEPRKQKSREPIALKWIKYFKSNDSIKRLKKKYHWPESYENLRIRFNELEECFRLDSSRLELRKKPDFGEDQYGIFLRNNEGRLGVNKVIDECFGWSNSSSRKDDYLIDSRSTKLCQPKVTVMDGPLLFINHACKPNARFYWSHLKQRFRLEVLRPMIAGDEILADYGSLYWKDSDTKCKCKSCHLKSFE
jgi:hypothetical protein